jgi:hypothetical protein
MKESEEAGETFGMCHRGLSRLMFEQKLVARLLALERLSGVIGVVPEEALAAFDRAAWEAWETSTI